MTEESPTPKPGWYTDPDQADTQRYWDGNQWTEQRAPKVARSESAIQAKHIRMAVGAVIGILVVLYFTGSLDHALYPVGLNHNECGKNGYGSVYCGDELTEYEEEVVQPIESAEQQQTEAVENLEAEETANRMTERMFGSP